MTVQERLTNMLRGSYKLLSTDDAQRLGGEIMAAGFGDVAEVRAERAAAMATLAALQDWAAAHDGPEGEEVSDIIASGPSVPATVKPRVVEYGVLANLSGAVVQGGPGWDHLVRADPKDYPGYTLVARPVGEWEPITPSTEGRET